ncbi:paramyosin-like [Capsicum annuum]|uniref:paramyosin-like n=1 Tax=Capsicum annuum TaxID=4072 RepID=UPI001FB170FB|nr:paramyosin-like [Capsicum annuum]
MSFSEKHLEDLSKRIEQVSEENQNLRQQLTQLQAEYQVDQDNRDYVRENYQEKVKELKSETLLTTMLREKLYSEEMDVKQLQDNLAAAVRGNDILKCEVQNALDALSCATPNLKYLELQVSSGSGKKNFTDLSKSPHGHSKKVDPKKSGRDSSRDVSVPVLIRTIRRLIKEKVQMASEVSSMLRNQVAERASAKEEANILHAELDSWTRRLETEKNELQLVLEKELDRRSSDWSLKLEKYRIEQHRLHERARELVEQNVSLQREVFSFTEKEVDNRIKMSFSEKHLEDLSKRIEQVSEENQNLRQQLTQLQAEYRVAQENRDYFWENYQEKG